MREHLSTFWIQGGRAPGPNGLEYMTETCPLSRQETDECGGWSLLWMLLNENSDPCGWWLCTAPVSILPSTAAGPSSTRLLICRNSSGSSPPTTVKPKPRRLFFNFVLMKVPFSSAGFLVKKGFPPAEQWRNDSHWCVHHSSISYSILIWRRICNIGLEQMEMCIHLSLSHR